MTRIGNETKTAKSQSTASNEGTTKAKEAEQAPTLDELDAGMSLARDYANPELPDVGPQSGMSRATDDVGTSTSLGLTPLEETPLARDLAGIEQQCALEVQGHAYELQSLGNATTGADGQCLERAADTLLSSSVAAGEAPAGSALPLLEQGIADAGEHVKQVADDKVRAEGEGFLSAAWSGVKSAAADVMDLMPKARPVPEPGQSHEWGIQGGVGVGLAGGESKDVLSIARERNSDGSGGGYVVAREVTLTGSLGAKGKLGAKAEVPGKEAALGVETEAARKVGGSIRLEFKSDTLDGAHDRLNDLITDKVVSAAVGGLSAFVPAASVLAPVVAEGAMSDMGEASAVTLTGSSAAELAASFGGLKAQLSASDSLSMRLELDHGEPTKGERTVTTALEASASASLPGDLGAKLGLSMDLKPGSVSASLARKTRFDVKDGEAQVTGEALVGTVDVNVAGRTLKAEIQLPPGKDADAVSALLEQGHSQAAFERLLESKGTVVLEGGQRFETGLGGSLSAGASLSVRGHHALQSVSAREQAQGDVADILTAALGRHVLGRGQEDLNKQMSAHHRVR